MRKTFLLITIIAFASCSGGFLSHFREIQHKIDEEYTRQQKLMENVQDLASAVESGNEPDSQAIADTIEGLVNATKFWGQFVGDPSFDSSQITEKLKYLQDNQDKFNEYTSYSAKQLIVQFNQQIWSINQAVKQIQSFATQLKGNAENVQMVTGMITTQSDELEGTDLMMYQGAIQLLYTAVTDAYTNTKIIKDQLNQTSYKMIKMNGDLSDCAYELRQTAKGKSEKFEEWRDDLRLKVYAGCIASTLCGPACVATCYTAGAVIIETDIANYKKDVERWTKEYNNFAAGYDSLAVMATQSSVVAKKWWNTTQDFQNVLRVQYNFLSSFNKVAPVKKGIRMMIVMNLGQLITACEKVEQTTGGRLEEYAKLDEEELIFSGELPHHDDFDKDALVHEMDADEVIAKIHEMCRMVNSGDQGDQQTFQDCIMGTMKFVADHKGDDVPSSGGDPTPRRHRFA